MIKHLKMKWRDDLLISLLDSDNLKYFLEPYFKTNQQYLFVIFMSKW